MKAAQQKIAFANRAIEQMRSAQEGPSRKDFDYHFVAFLALLGALRQFITVDPHKQWVYSTDESDLSYCSCIDLRNVDVHTTSVAPARAHYEMQLADAIVHPQDRLTVQVMCAGQPPEPERELVEKRATVEPQNPSGSAASSVTATFFVNVDALPPNFATLPHNAMARPTKAEEEALLREKSAIDVASDALRFFESAVLPQAQQRGLPIP